MLPSIGARETEFKSMTKEPNKNWQPPFLMGEKLRWWAHATAETVTGTKLRAPRSAETAVELVREIHDGAQQAMDAHAYEIGQGVRSGLSRGIEAAGLDGNFYELNSALVVVLDKSDAADCWARGEDVFEHCHKA